MAKEEQKATEMETPELPEDMDTTAEVELSKDSLPELGVLKEGDNFELLLNATVLSIQGSTVKVSASSAVVTPETGEEEATPEGDNFSQTMADTLGNLEL